MTSKEAAGADGGPSSSRRREFLRGGFIAAIGLAVVGLSGPAIGKTSQKLLQGAPFPQGGGSATQGRVTLSSLGEQVSISEAMAKASFGVSVPKSLPEGTTFAQGRVTP